MSRIFIDPLNPLITSSFGVNCNDPLHRQQCSKIEKAGLTIDPDSGLPYSAVFSYIRIALSAAKSYLTGQDGGDDISGRPAAPGSDFDDDDDDGSGGYSCCGRISSSAGVGGGGNHSSSVAGGASGGERWDRTHGSGGNSDDDDVDPTSSPPFPSAKVFEQN
jgi:hypothetical protein